MVLYDLNMSLLLDQSLCQCSPFLIAKMDKSNANSF